MTAWGLLLLHRDASTKHGHAMLGQAGASASVASCCDSHAAAGPGMALAAGRGPPSTEAAAPRPGRILKTVTYHNLSDDLTKHRT